MGRRSNLAKVHAHRSEYWLDVSCLGSNEQTDPRFVHRCVIPALSTQNMLMAFSDTMGYAFTFHVVWLLSGVPIGAYIHYPTISTDMLARVKSRKSGVTNDTTIATSMTRSAGKLLYYRLFMYYYALSLRRASFLMVNSSWTKNHIDDILKHHDRPVDLLHWLSPLILLRLLLSVSSPSLERADIVYPPCDTTEMMQLPLEGRDKTIISIAQFR